MKSKKILALLLSMLMVLAAFPLAAFAAADADAPIARYNFGVSTVPEKENWIPVDETTVYSAELGYGLGKPFDSSSGRNRGDLTSSGLYYDPMTSSWLGSDNWNFSVDLPNGSYDVVIFCADMNGDNASNMAKATKNGTRFTIEGVQHEYLHIQTAKLPKVDGLTQPYFITYPVTVTDGQLNIQVGGLTQEEKNAALAQINIYDPEFDVTYNWGNAVQGYVNGISIYNAGKAPTALADLLSASGTGTVTPPVETYDVTVTGGTANPAKAEAGTPITVTANVPQGKQFVSWTVNAGTVTPTGNTSLTTETLTFNMPAEAVSLTANFEDIPPAPTYDVTVVGGTASPAKAEAGTAITVTANVPQGKRFVSWTVNAGTVIPTGSTSLTTETLTFNMPAEAVSLTANFEDIPTPPAGEITVVSDKKAYAPNETIVVTITTPDTVKKAYLAAENGNGLATARNVTVNDNGTTTWVLTFSLGSKGNRVLTVYTDGVATDKTVSFVVDTGAPVEQGEVKIISASMDATGKVNEPITATIKTSTSVTKVRLFNESGMGLAPSSCTYVDEEGVRTWTYTLSVGTPGTRSFVVKAAGADMVWADGTETLSTRIARS